MSNFDSVIRHVKEHKVLGWLTSGEATFLASCASRVPIGYDIVEVGAYQGLSTIFLGAGSMEGNMSKVYTVDPHEPISHNEQGVYGPGDMQEFYRNISIAGVGSVVYALCVSSSVAAGAFRPGSVCLLWIDGDHSRRGVEADISHWLGTVMPGGLVLFHDRSETGVFEALVNRPECLNILGVVDQIAVCRNECGPAAAPVDWPLELMMPIQALIEQEKAAGTLVE